MDIFSEAPKQLIHSDPGPDNILFNGDSVYSIIDFTPEYENEIYSLCQFCYWNFYWRGAEIRSDNWLNLYWQRETSTAEKRLFQLYMVKAALFRVAGPLMAGNTNLEQRFDILEQIVA